jgi:hypothetical protein
MWGPRRPMVQYPTAFRILGWRFALVSHGRQCCKRGTRPKAKCPSTTEASPILKPNQTALEHGPPKSCTDEASMA